MEDFAGDDTFVFDYFSDGAEFGYDPFDANDGDTVEAFCASGFSFLDGDDNLVVEDHAFQASDEDPVLETLGRSFDSDEESLGLALPELVSAISSTLDLAEHSSEEEPAGGDEYAREFVLGGSDHEPGLVIDEDADDDGDDVVRFMRSQFDIDPPPVSGGFHTLANADEGGDVVVGGNDMGEGAEFDLRLPAFRMLVDDLDSDADEFLEVLTLRAGQIQARSPGLPSSRVAVEALPEVAPTEEEASSVCAVCKDGVVGQLIVRLPCKHFFHGDCIRPWLLIRNTCPVCRFEVPAGYPEYDRQGPTADGASRVQDGAMAQSGSAGGRATVGSERCT